MTFETQNLPSPFGSDNSDSGLDENILPKGALLDNRYEVLKVLGLGGMGAVYQARDLRFTGVARLCAVKEMISTTTDPHVRRLTLQNFEREANILATLNHPSIAKVIDYFTEGVRSYLVMEYVEGQDLEALLESTEDPLSEEQVVDWAVQICEVLSYLHGHNPPIIYRDMKPSNVMLRSGNRITLIDFGIAKTFQSGQKGTMIGTEGYSPPEQYRGVADARSDIYSLGATMHHLLTRRDPRTEPPFTFHDEPIRKLNPAVSEATEQVVMRALEYDPEQRYTSVDELKRALQQTRQPSPPAKPSTAPSRPVAPERPQAGTMPLPPSAATTMLDQRPVHVPTVDTGASGGILPVWVFKCEDELRSSPTLHDGVVYIGAYDNNLYALDAKTGEFQWKYPTEGGIASTPCVYKDKILIGSEDRVTYAISARTGRVLWTCPTEGRVRSSVKVEFEHAFFGSDDHRLYAVNAQNGRAVWRFEAMGPIRSTPAIDDEIVYVGSDDSHLYALDLQTGNIKWKFRANRSIISSPVIYEEMVLVGSNDWTFYALDKRTGWSIWRLRTGQAVISSPRVHEDIVYFGSIDGNLYAVDAKSGRTIWKFSSGGQIVSRPAIYEGHVYFGNNKGDVISVNIKSGRERWRFTTGGPVPGSPAVGDGVVYIGSTDHNLYALPA